MSAIKLRIKIILKAIFHALFGKTRLKAWILRAFSRDYELDSAQLNELIAKPIAKDAPKGDFIATLTSFPARVGILKYALHSIFSQDLRAKKVVLVLDKNEFFAESVKNKSREAQPLASSGEGEGVVREGEGSDFAIQAPAPSLKKNARGEKGDFNADLSARVREEIDFAKSQNLQGGLPRRFCESARNDNFLDSSPTAQNDKIGTRVAESSLDSALPTQEANSSIVDEFSHLCEVSDADRTNGSSRKRTLRKCEKSPQDDEFALDSANLDNLLPADILAFKKYGLEILWTAQNLRQYNKIIPILRTFPNENIITLDDDIYYNSRTFSTLYAAHLSNKRAIWAHKARIVPFSARKIADFFEWKIIRKRHKKSQNLPRFDIFLEGCGGVLYPPNCLYKDAQDSAKFMRLAPKADDIWLWAMALLKGTKIACVKPPLMGDGAAFTNSASNPALWHYNMNGGNDRQMRAILKEYPQILRILAQEKAQEKADEKMGEKAQAGEKS